MSAEIVFDNATALHSDCHLLPLGLTPEATDAYPMALPLVEKLLAGIEALEPVRKYLQLRKGMAPNEVASAEEAHLRYFVMTGCVDKPLAPSPEGDEYWHAMLMHTRLYGPWCVQYFGRMVHHVPSTGESHPTPAFLREQYELGKFFFGEDNNPYRAASGHCSNSHGCTHGCSHCNAQARCASCTAGGVK